MKRLLLLLGTIMMCSYLAAQEDKWDVYLEGFKVKSVAIENDDVWGVTDSSLFRLNKLDSSTAFYPFPYYNDQMSGIIEVDSNGVIWMLLTEYLPHDSSINVSYIIDRIYSFDENHWKHVNTSRYNIGILDMFPPSSMAIDNKNNIWITIHDRALYKIEQDNIIRIKVENPGHVYNDLSQVVSDKDGNIWALNKVTTDMWWVGLDLLKYEGDNWISYYSGTFPYFDAHMTTDRTGNLWVNGMELMGLTIPSVPVVQKLDVESHSLSEPIRGDTLNSIYSNLHIARFEAIEGENKFWGTRRVDGQNKGIAVISDSDYNIYTTSNSELPSDTVYQIAIDSTGTKWFCTAKGLAAFNENLPVESVGIDNCPSGDLTEGDTLQLTATVLPADASNQSISWYSSEPSVLSVDENGLLSAVHAGTATITVTTNDGEFTSSCEITVVAAIDILTEVVIPDEIFPGDTLTFYAKYETSQSRDIGASIQLNSEPWTNYGFNIRTVPAGTGTDSVNLIVPLDIPIADNAYKIVLGLLPVGGDLNESLYEIRIVDVSVVSKLIPVEGVGIDNCPSGDLTEGDTLQLTATVLPADASNQSISWYSSEPSMLSVDENGLLSAVNAGTAYITVTTSDGGFISSCEMNVVASTDIKANAMKQIEIFPNPTGDYINIQLPEALKRSTVTILNIQGETIITNSIDNKQNQLDVSHLPSGVYIVRIESQQNYILKKFIKQ